MSATGKIYIVQAVHPTVPGTPITAHATKASADKEACDLVNIMLADCDLPPLNGSNWEAALEAIQDQEEDSEADVWITEVDLKIET